MATKFRKIRQVTLPVLKLEKGTPRYIYILSAMYEGEKIDANKSPAVLIHAVDIETGEEGNVICPAVMQSELEKHYPNNEYVRKAFEVVVTRAPGKDYNLVTIAEVAPPDDFEPPKAEHAISEGRTPASKAGRKPGSAAKTAATQS